MVARAPRAIGYTHGIEERRASLRLLDDKISLLEEAVLAGVAAPPVQLSLEGLAFPSVEPLIPGGWLAVHLMLPVSYHLVCTGQVTHCTAAADAVCGRWGGSRSGDRSHSLVTNSFG